MLYRDDELGVLINICKSPEDAISYRFPVDAPNFQDIARNHELRTVVGCNGLCEKIRIFDAELHELAIAYLKKYFHNHIDDVKNVFFEKLDDDILHFTLFLGDSSVKPVRIRKASYDAAVDYVKVINAEKCLNSYFVDINLFDYLKK